MSFIAKENEQNNLELYKGLVRQAGQINSQMSAWQGGFDSLRASVDAEKQGELDTKRAAFIAQLRATLGL